MIWAGAVMIWAGACSNTNFPTLKRPKNAKKVKCDRRTDRRTDRPTDGRTDRPTRWLIGRVPATKIIKKERKKKREIEEKEGSHLATLWRKEKRKKNKREKRKEWRVDHQRLEETKNSVPFNGWAFSDAREAEDGVGKVGVGTQWVELFGNRRIECWAIHVFVRLFAHLFAHTAHAFLLRSCALLRSIAHSLASEFMVKRFWSLKWKRVGFIKFQLTVRRTEENSLSRHRPLRGLLPKNAKTDTVYYQDSASTSLSGVRVFWWTIRAYGRVKERYANENEML